MGNKKRSDQSTDGGDYADGTESLSDDEQAALGDLEAEEAYEPPEAPEEALEDTVMEGFEDELTEGDADLKTLDDPDAGDVDWEEPPPSPEEADAFRKLEETPVIGAENQPDEVLGDVREKTLAPAKEHLKQLNDPEIAERTADKISTIVGFVPSAGQSSVSPAAGKPADEVMLATKHSVGDSRAKHESTIKHEMLHVTFEAHGYGVNDVPNDRYDPEEDNFVDVENPTYDNRLLQRDAGEAPEEIQNLARAAEQSWLKMQSAGKDEEFDKVAFDPSRGNSRYPSVSPDEAAAQFHQVMQEDDIEPRVNWFYEHGDMTRAYTDVFTPTEAKQRAISYLHERDPDQSPYDANPYPGAEPDDEEKALLDMQADRERYDGPE